MPIVVGFAAVIIAIPMVLVYPWFNQGLTWFGDMISDNTVGGGFIYGTVNRLLIPIGLHHLLNFVPWFMLGSFEGDTGGAMVSLALTAFLTGITEPLEFAFMFLAWPLYVAHAVLTGSSLAVMNLIGARDGFGFSAGAIDFLLNLGIAEKPWAIIVAGLVYAVIYYVIFRFMIVKLDLKTPGRDPEQDPAPEADAKTEAA
ncbi:PTS transporter subunit EIIC [Corynebacterium xerosis]|uniref:PTS transporter subunit EIIC n=1 Tax=Corynebacterium xerosis TaxID=1725 RepID=UPI0026D79F46